MHRQGIDLTGQKFGRLRVIQYAGKNKRGTRVWLCECDCGNTTSVVTGSLVNGDTQSCGCIHSEMIRQRLFKHGQTDSPMYKEWQSIKRRCYNPNAINYDRYGARGIAVCDEWRDDFQAFYDDVSHLPHFEEPGYSLDRINNDGNYEPENVRWASRIEQANNKRNNRRITYMGETHTLAEWSRILNIKYSILHDRLYRYGWSVERAFYEEPKISVRIDTL